MLTSHIKNYCLAVVAVLAASHVNVARDFVRAAELSVEIEPITRGPQHHLFGYIGQCQTIPWNRSGRYIVTLRSRFHDHMPEPHEAADIVLIDTQDNQRVIPVEQTRAWNLQQGTMLYWNPQAAETQFFFNDRDPETGHVFTVLYDIARRQRVREYRFADTPIANSGVAQAGGYFVAVNYGRLARLRSVTGYPGAYDWTDGENAPDDDGVFRVDIQTGQKRLLVSYRQLAELLRPTYENIGQMGLYINHTLCNRPGDRIFFFARGRLGSRAITANMPCTIKPDGSGLTTQTFIGGHPEWAEGHLMIGARDDQQVLYDVDKKTVVGVLGNESVFAKPGGDIALSSDGRWFVNGFSQNGQNHFTILRRADGAHVRTRGFSRGPYTSGDLRVDPAPRWNRTNDAILVPGFTQDGTRQLHVIRVVE